MMTSRRMKERKEGRLARVSPAGESVMIRDFKSPLDPSPPKPRSLSRLEQSRTKYIEKNELSLCENIQTVLRSLEIIL